MSDITDFLSLRREEKMMLEQLNDLKSDLYSIKGVSWDKIPNTQRCDDPTLKKYLYITDYENDIIEIHKTIDDLKEKIISRCDSLNLQYRQVLKDVYLFDIPVNQLSVSMNLSIADTYRIKREATKKYEEIYGV